MQYSETKGTFKTLGGEEHVKIIDFYLEVKSMAAVTEKLERSSATVHSQINRHNESIKRQGFSSKCKRIKGAHYTQKVVRAML